MNGIAISHGDKHMGAAYFIVLDNPDPGFDPFVDGKAISRDSKGISRVAPSLGLKPPDAYFSMGSNEAATMREEFGIGDDVQTPPEQWFEPDEGLTWVARLRAHIQSDSKAVKDPEGVLADLAEYERVLTQAKAIGAKWHLSVDF